MAQAAAKTANTPVLARLMELLSPLDATDRRRQIRRGFSTALARCPLLLAEGLPLGSDMRNLQPLALARTGDRSTPEWGMDGSCDQPVVLGPPDGLRPVVGVELAIGAARVLLDGV